MQERDENNLNTDETAQQPPDCAVESEDNVAEPVAAEPVSAGQEGGGSRQVLKWLKIASLLFLLSVLCGVEVIMSAGKRAGSADRDGKLSSLGKDGVAWVTVRGVISSSRSDSPFEKGTGNVSRVLRTMADKDNVKAIVLDINTPGGSVGAVQEIYDAVLYAKNVKKKPIVAMFRDVSASGGYYIAAPADRIIAQPGTLTGSIGVIFSLGNFKGLFEKIGVRMEAVKSGKFKDIGSPYRELSSEERAMFQAIVDDTYQQFYTAVKSGRGLPDDRLAGLCDGRIFTGRQALANGLVDQLGGETEARRAAGKLAGLGDSPKIIRNQDPWDSVRELLNMEAKSSAAGALKTFADFSSPSAAYLWVY
ncbi:MAG: signal peptide peptidase SppA [Elusimicrobiaceae bacterium]|nr:signal peptide peptidase SppA [Elusimicrobiaceae bacterium]